MLCFLLLTPCPRLLKLNSVPYHGVIVTVELWQGLFPDDQVSQCAGLSPSGKVPGYVSRLGWALI